MRARDDADELLRVGAQGPRGRRGRQEGSGARDDVSRPRGEAFVQHARTQVVGKLLGGGGEVRGQLIDTQLGEHTRSERRLTKVENEEALPKDEGAHVVLEEQRRVLAQAERGRSVPDEGGHQ